MRLRYGFYLVILAIGLFTLFHDTLLSGLQLIPGDPGDGHLTNYFLEHSFQFITNRQYIGELFSPAFFYPRADTLALSENLFGAAPIYWLLRFATPPDTAFALWVMIVSALNFGAMVFVLRRFQVHPVLSSLGGFLMAFPLNRAVRLSHAQLLPQFLTPIALFYLWQFIQRPTKRIFLLLLGLSYWQILCGVYLGWFLLFGMAVKLLVMVILRSPLRWPPIIQFVQQKWGFILVSTAIWAIGVWGLFAPYLRVQAIFGPRTYAEVETMLPRFASWFALAPSGSLWAKTLSPLSQGLPMAHEHTIFLGMLPYGLAAWTLVVLVRPVAWLSPARRQIVQVFFGTAAIIFLLSLYIPEHHSAWWLVYKYVPGASVIRAMTRISGLINIELLIAGLVVLDSYLASRSLRRTGQAVILSGLLTFGVAEQYLLPQISYNAQVVRSAQQELTQLLQANCQLAYYAFPESRLALAVGVPPRAIHPPQFVNFPRSSEGLLPYPLLWIYAQIEVMWAGLAANVPVINGYSGNIFPGFPPAYTSWQFPQVLTWLNQNPLPQQSVCYITDRVIEAVSSTGSGAPTSGETPAAAWQLSQQLTSAHYQVRIFAKSAP